ncbi:MAG: flagellar hook-length control protein FliK, partial [Thermodesulfobacteriota bacterium]|nr:flagellar hook-length control protein FliK [Thermodesulfobacteriota bacterium]
RTGEKSFILAKNDGSGNDIKNLLKHQGLKSIKTAVEHEKTGIKEFSDHKMEVLPKAISSQLYLVDKISSAGEYHHASFYSSSSSAVVNENVNSYGIEPSALIKQIANGLKRPGRVRIMLNPPRLGALDVDVHVKDNKVHIILQAENNDVRHILQSNVESLKSSLRSHGLIADNVNVFVQEKTDGANYGSGQNETLSRERSNRERNEEDRTEKDSPDHVSPLPEEENPGVRIDGRVSLFA